MCSFVLSHFRSYQLSFRLELAQFNCESMEEFNAKLAVMQASTTKGFSFIVVRVPMPEGRCTSLTVRYACICPASAFIEIIFSRTKTKLMNPF